MDGLCVYPKIKENKKKTENELESNKDILDIKYCDMMLANICFHSYHCPKNYYKEKDSKGQTCKLCSPHGISTLAMWPLDSKG